MDEEIKNCKRCELWKTRTNVVIGAGSLDTDILFIGEAPGYNEDKKGKPFVGKAGKILDELLESVDLAREDVYITNILKCRPPKNRDPKPKEIKACTPYLNNQIEEINPEKICTLGNFATKYILKSFDLTPESIGKIHGKSFKVRNLLGDLTILPLYHPAAATYNPNMMPTLLEDFKKVLGV
ncbi:MAG: type-4 uracil-DNA glycosylase [Euryarchaeota archaeon]|nr:type-4 uracil-DNA glycosylase [Euryarchaeota archaeon]